MEVKDGADQRFVEDLKRIIKKTEDHDISVDEICHKANLSRSQLYRRVKAATGLSLSLFVRKVRLEKAKHLLDTTTLTIAEVSYRCGISSPQNFTKYFTSEFGYNPREYRKRPLPLSEVGVESISDTYQESTSDEKIDAGEAAVSRTNHQKEAVPKVSAKQLVMLISAGLILALSLFTLLRPAEVNDPVSDGEAVSVAVIPFKNYSNVDDDFLGEGVVDDVLTHLTKFRSLRVVSRTSSEQYKDTKKSIPLIGEELQVQYVLEGSIRQADGKIRITVQLIEAASDKHVWARNYDRSQGNIMDIQSEIALDIARSLDQEIKPAMEENITKLPTENAEAYQALLRGRYLLRSRVKEDMESSIAEFDRALMLDPEFSDAYTGKAAAYYLLRDIYFDKATAGQYLQEAEKNAQLAIIEDKDNAQAFAYLGLIYQAQYNWVAAASTFEIALTLSPSDALINYWYANNFRKIGKEEEALKYHAIANELDPLYPVINAGYIYTCAMFGRHQLADELLDQWKQVYKQSFLHETAKGYNLLLQGQYEQALPYIDRSLSLNPNFKTTSSAKIYVLGKLGRRSEVEAYLEAVRPDRSNEVVRAVLAWLSIGEEAKAIELLRKGADMGRIDNDILVDPRYKPILSHPSVQQVLREYGLYQYLPAV